MALVADEPIVTVVVELMLPGIVSAMVIYPLV